MTQVGVVTGFFSQAYTTVWNTVIPGTTSQQITVNTTINAVVQMELYPPSVRALLSVSREAMLSLLDTRDFLGYQLAHAKGTIGIEEFRAIASDFLARIQPVDPQVLASKTRALIQLIGTRADSDTVSTVFSCELDEAEAAIVEVTNQINHQQMPLLFGSSGDVP
jgi:hypothetical protein